MPSAGSRELHPLGILDDSRGAQDLELEANYAPVLAEVGNYAGQTSSLSRIGASRRVMTSELVSRS